MIADEFVTLLKFDVIGADKIQKMKIGLEKLTEGSKMAMAGIGGMISSVALFADRVSKDITTNYEWAKSVGIAADSYQKFDYAAKLVGGSLEDVKSDLEKWVRSAKASGQSLEEVFLQETQAIQGMSAEESRQILLARDYSETAIRMIQQGTQKLDESLSRVGTIPESELQAAKEYTDTWRQLQAEITLVGMQAVAKALPTLREILEHVRRFLFENKDSIKNFIINFFIAAANISKLLYQRLKPLFGILEKFITQLGKLNDGSKESQRTIKLLETAIKALLILFASTTTVTFIANLIAIGKAIGIAVGVAWGFVSALLSIIGTIGVWAAGLISVVGVIYTMITNWSGFCEGFVHALKHPMEFLQTFVNLLSLAKDIIVDVGKSIGDWLYDVGKGLGIFDDVDLEELSKPLKEQMKNQGLTDFSKEGISSFLGTTGGATLVPSTTNQNSRSYVDNRNITINTNATSGPALASYFKNNDMMQAGMGMAGAF